jgi:hypothetical protein
MKNLTNLFLVFVVVLVVVGCCGKRFVTSSKKDCLSADGSQIALTDMYGGVTIIDSKTGNILTKKESEKDGQELSFGVALCAQNNEIFSVYPNLLVNLKDNRRIEHKVKGRVFDMINKETLLTFSGGEPTTDSDGDYDRSRPLEIYLEKLGEDTKDLKPITVSLDKFEGVRTLALYYWIKPLHLLDSENLLVIAGATPQTYSQTLTETYVSPEPWGFYIFNLKTEQAKILGTIKKADADINFHSFTFVEPENFFAVYDTKQDKEIIRKTIGEGEIYGVIFSDDETKIAVGVKYYRGEKRRVQYFTNIYDIKTGDLIKSIPLNFEAEGLFDLRDDELILLSSKKILKININSESKMWETIYFDK